jgi:UDP-N-acetylglucosamine 2-epimerase (non-hydrolysing)
MHIEDEHRLRESVAAANAAELPLTILFLATRPCYVKLASVVHALRDSDLPYLVIDSGQHYEAHLTEPRRRFGYEGDIDIYLHTDGDLVGRLASLGSRLDELNEKLKRVGLTQPAVPMVSGDTSTAGSVPFIWYLLTGTSSIHIEAGLRSMGPGWEWPEAPEEALTRQTDQAWWVFPNDPFPEGAFTRTATHYSAVHFAPVDRNRNALLRENIPEEHIYTVGSLSADAVNLIGDSGLDDLFAAHPELSSGRWLRVDMHRRENMAAPHLSALLGGLGQYSAEGGRVVLVSTNAFQRAVRALTLDDLVDGCVARGVLLTKPWPQYESVISFLRSPQCAGIYTDSGGLQEEAHLLGVPCLTARWSTDRPETVLDSAGNRLLPPISADFVRGGVASFLETSRVGPFGDLYPPGVAGRIVAALAAALPLAWDRSGSSGASARRVAPGW